MRLVSKIGFAFAWTAALFVIYYLGILHPARNRIDFMLWGRELSLLSPAWLGLICLLPLLWFISRYSLVDLSRGQQALSFSVRFVLLLGIALALARPSLSTYSQRICTVLAVDVSESVSDHQLRTAHKMIQQVWDARKQNEVRLITFAQSPKLIPLDDQRAVPLPPLQRHQLFPNRGGPHTDIQAAIQHALGTISPHCLPRLVLITDGNETRGDALAETHLIANKGIKLSIYRLPERTEPEVLVRSLHLPKEIRLGAPFELTAEIHSTQAMPVTLTLYKDAFINGLDGLKKVDLKPGRNEIKFQSLVQAAGLVHYRLSLGQVKHDTWSSNNSAEAILPVIGRPRVLLIEGEPSTATYLQRALSAEKMDVTVRGPHGVPSSSLDLQSYDLLILSDLPAMFLSLPQMSAVQTYVRDWGGGFIMIGGQNAFGAGGYSGTTIEKILPIHFETEKKRDQPSLALALVIDRSGSMTGPKLELAKEAAKATAELLGPADLISIIAFDHSAYVVVRLQPAAHRLRILNDIARIQAGGGTSIRPALLDAYDQLQEAEAKVKHVILLSDGQSPYNGIGPLVEEMAGSQITVSTVGVGEGTDRALLQMIAERGNGRFYFTDDVNSIPKIFTKETSQVARSALVEERIKAVVVKQAGLLGGIDWSTAPSLRGYVSTKLKPLSETLLMSQYREPILTHWRVGLGKTAIFTSDAKNRWAVDWLRWPSYQMFWAQLSREIMRHRIQRSFDMSATLEHGLVHVVVDAMDTSDHFINGLNSSISVLAPRFPTYKQTEPLEQTAAGRYESFFSLPNYGAYLLRAVHRSQGKPVAESIASFALPYPQEYTDLVQNKTLLQLLVTTGKGTIDPSPELLFNPGSAQIRFDKEVWPWAIYGVIIIFLFDVLLRRVRIFAYQRRTVDTTR